MITCVWCIKVSFLVFKDVPSMYIIPWQLLGFLLSPKACSDMVPLLCVCLRPNLIDMSKVYRQTNLENLEQAFSVAERELGVTRLLDPEGKLDLSLRLSNFLSNLFFFWHPFNLAHRCEQIK